MSLPSQNKLDEYLEFANELADHARQIARKYFRQPLTIEHKQDSTPVTIADKEIESKLRKMIGKRYPQHGILGEEFASELNNQASVWIIDPIDGTKSFSSGKPLFGSLIAFFSDKIPVLGIIEAPATGERWVGTAEGQTYLNGKPCETSNCQSLAAARLYATSPYMFSAEDAKHFHAISKAADFTCYGGDCYSYGLLASGHVDLVIEADLKPFDFAALINPITSAGGVITDWQGEALNLQSDGRVIAAATSQLHAEVLDRLQN